MRATLIGPDDAAWTRALARVPHDVYHLPEYVAQEAERTGTLAEAFVATDGDRTLFLPYLVRSCGDLGPEAAGLHDATSPQGYAGPVTSGEACDAGFVAEAMDALRTTLRGHGRVSGFFRMHPILDQEVADRYPAEAVTDHGLSVAIDLEGGPDALFAQMKDKQRESIRRAQRLGYAAAFEPLAEVAGPVHDVYSETMARVEAADAYRFPLAYFESLARLDHVHACLVRQGTDVAAACLFFEHMGIVQAHLGGTRDAHLPAAPFVLVLHEASRWAQSRGARWLHLGGGVGGTNDGVLRFKSSLGRGRFRLRSLRVVADPDAYARLVAMRAAAGAGDPGQFFPAYRAPAVRA